MKMYCKIYVWFVLSAVAVLAMEQQVDTVPHDTTIDESSESQAPSLSAILKEIREDLTVVKTKIKNHEQSANAKISSNRWQISDVEETADRLGTNLQHNKQEIKVMSAAVKAFRKELAQYKDKLSQIEAKPDSSRLQHSYLDETAQAMCASVTPNIGHVMAVRRGCGAGTPTCNTICTSAPITARMKSHRHTGSVCFDAFHLYYHYESLPTNVGQPYSEWATGKPGTMSYHYGLKSGCSFPVGICGPNYCCCKSA